MPSQNNAVVISKLREKFTSIKPRPLPRPATFSNLRVRDLKDRVFFKSGPLIYKINIPFTHILIQHKSCVYYIVFKSSKAGSEKWSRSR